MLLPIRSVSGPVILVLFFCHTKNQLSARKCVSERHHFFAAPRANLSLEGWWASSQWLDKANAASQMIWKSKSRKLQNTDVRGCCESLKRRICRTALWSSVVRRNKPDGVARYIQLSERALAQQPRCWHWCTIFFFLDFRSPFLQFARMRCKLMFFQVKSRVCPDASDLWQIHGQQS